MKSRYSKVKAKDFRILLIIMISVILTGYSWAGDFSWNDGASNDIWSDQNNWTLTSGVDANLNGYPDATDNALVDWTDSPTFTGTIGCTNLTIGGTNSPTVTLGAAAAFTGSVIINTGSTLDVNGNTLDVDVDATVDGTLQDGTYATARNFTLGGNLDVDGTLSYVSVEFDGSSDQVISGTGTITFYYIEFDNTGGGGIEVSNSSGSQEYSQLILTGGTFEPSNSWNTTVQDAASTTTVISITGGTFSPQSSNTFVFNVNYDPPGPPIGPSTARISNTSSNTTINFQNIDYSSNNTGNILEFYDDAGSTTFQINGTLNFTGTAKGGITRTNSILSYDGTNGTVKYSVGGTVDPDEWPSGGVANVLLQSGTVTIPTGTFEVDNKLTRVNGSLSITGTFRYDSANETTLEYAPSPAAAVNIGGEWPTGITTRPSNVIVNNSGQTVTEPTSTTDRVIPKTLSMTAGTLAMGDNDLTILGSIASSDIAGSGSVTVNNASSNINMGDGTAQQNQTITGSVTLTNLTINKTGANNDVTISGSPTITNNFTVTNGDVTANGTVTISSGELILNNSSTFTVDAGALSVSTLDLNNTSTFTTGGKNITGLTTLTADNGTTYEFNGTSVETTPLSSVTFGNVNMNNSAGLNVNGSVTVNGTLTFSQDATINTSSSNTLTIADGENSISGASSTRYVNGPLRWTITNANAHTFPIGVNGKYRPATIDYTDITGASGDFVLEFEYEENNPGGNPPSGVSQISANCRYVLTQISGDAPTDPSYDITLRYSDSGFDPYTRNRILVQNAALTTVPSYELATSQSQTETPEDVSGTADQLPSNNHYLAFGSGGTTVTWIGGGDNSTWSDADNWSPTGVPISTDIVTIDVAGGASVIIGGSTSAQASALTIGNGSGSDVTLEVSSSSVSPLTVTNALTLNSEAALQFSAANGDISAGSTTFDAQSDVEYQSRTIPVDTYGNLTINGATGTSGSGTVTVAGNLVKNGGSFTTSQLVSVAGSYTNTAGTATFSGGLTVNGTNFAVNGGSVAGTVTLSGSSGGQNIDGSGSEITIDDLIVNNSSGVTLLNDLRVTGILTLTSGLITTDDTNLLTIGSAGSIENYDATHYINGPMANANTNNMFFPIGNNGEYRPVAVIYNSGTSPTVVFKMVANNPNGTAGSGLNNISTIRYWIGQVISGSINGRVELHWGDNDGVDGALTDLAVGLSTDGSGGTYNSIGNAVRSGDSNSGWIRSNYTSIRSQPNEDFFTLGSQAGDNSLPVELLAFEAIGDYGNVTINWTTGSEIDNLGFNLYRSVKDEEDWFLLNEYLISGQGNSVEETDYEFVDRNIVAGETYVYKLESVSIDGVIEVENIVEVSVPVPTAYALSNNYPNPFNPTTNLKFQLPDQSSVSMIIYDIQGQKVKELLQNQSYAAGEHVVQWDATDELNRKVAAGMYIYRFTAGNYQKFGKMMLIK